MAIEKPSEESLITKLKRENQHLQQQVERLQHDKDRLQREKDRLEREIERVRKELEAALRASKRQAAPHSRGTLKSHPKRPGRKPGRNCGRRACRPKPSRIDERMAVSTE